MSSLVEIEHYDEASKGFLADVYATGDPHPKLHVSSNSRESLNPSKFLEKSVILTVAQITEHTRCFKNNSITIYNAVCFDGSMGFCRLTFNSGLSVQVRDESIYPGCSIEVIDHDIIWNQPDESGVKRAVM